MYLLHHLVTGFPARSATHGGLGWSSVCLLEGDGRRILVDTGPPAYIPLLHKQLAAHNLTPADITHILMTHLHWDHVCNFTMFSHSQMIVPRSEMDWASRQPPGTAFIPDLHVAKLAEIHDRVLFVGDGDEPITGVETIWTPGHTPGHFAYGVASTSGAVIFAGDAVKNRHELATGQVDSTLDADDSFASIRRLRQRLVDDPQAVLIPGHDVPLAVAAGEVTALAPQVCDFQVFLTNDGGAQARTVV